MINEDDIIGQGMRRMGTTLAVLSVAFFVFVGFQTFELIRARNALTAAQIQQDPAIQQGQKIRNQLQALAQGTLKLSNEGDENARVIVESLRQQGVTINPPAAAPAPAK